MGAGRPEAVHSLFSSPIETFSLPAPLPLAPSSRRGESEEGIHGTIGIQAKGYAINLILAHDDYSAHTWAAAALLHAIPFPEGTFATVFKTYRRSKAADLDGLKATLSAWCELLRTKDVQAEYELLPGSLAEKIVEYAHSHRSDLIVIGAMKLWDIFGIFLGRAVQQVIQHVDCPVWMARFPYRGLHRILLVIDDSPYSQQAVQYLGQFPFPKHASLRVMHVLPAPDLLEGILETPQVKMLTRNLPGSQGRGPRWVKEEMEGQALLDRAVRSLQPLFSTVRGVLQRGEAVLRFLEYAKDERIDLIVAGSRGLGPVRSWLMGSISRELVARAECSVLVVRNQRFRD